MIDDPCPLTHRERARLLRHANANPWTGQASIPASHQRLTTGITDPDRPTHIIVTVDVGPHASGWWANADYDLCWHLSVSHPTGKTELVQIPGTFELARRPRLEAPTDDEVRAWATAFFADSARLGWLEPPVGPGDRYRLPGVGHFRLFVDRETGEPILPTGEVYTLRPWAGSPPKIIDGRLGADVR